jgi:chromosome segregation ATPase
MSSAEQEIKTGEGVLEKAPAFDNTARLSELRAEIDSLASDLTALEEEEKKTQQSIDTMSKRRFKYNRIQMMQLQNDLEPLQQQLYSTQQKKGELLQRKAYLHGEINALEHQ